MGHCPLCCGGKREGGGREGGREGRPSVCLRFVTVCIDLCHVLLCKYRGETAFFMYVCVILFDNVLLCVCVTGGSIVLYGCVK